MTIWRTAPKPLDCLHCRNPIQVGDRYYTGPITGADYCAGCAKRLFQAEPSGVVHADEFAAGLARLKAKAGLL